MFSVLIWLLFYRINKRQITKLAFRIFLLNWKLEQFYLMPFCINFKITTNEIVLLKPTRDARDFFEFAVISEAREVPILSLQLTQQPYK